MNITYSVGYDTYQIPIVLISFTGDLPLTNILPTTKQVEVLKNTYAGWIYDWELRSYAPNLPKIVPGKEEFYLTVGGSFEGFTGNGTDANASFGARICNTTGPVSIGEMASTEWRDMTPDHVLTVPGSNVPVFVAGG